MWLNCACRIAHTARPVFHRFLERAGPGVHETEKSWRLSTMT
jgi:hypothetical protein